MVRSFNKEAYSLQSKLHLSKLNTVQLIGLGLVVCAVLVLAGYSIWNATAGHSFAISRDVDSLQTEEATSNAGVNEEQGENTSERDTGGSESTEGSVKSGTWFVHVTGCVKKPGLYEVSQGARVNDAIVAAGGFSKDASQESINLARELVDGEQIVVLSVSEAKQQNEAGVSSGGSSSSSSSSTSSTSSGANSANGGATLININTASAQELTALSGIGEATAAKIIADRETNGAFKKKEDIKRVSGIGDKKYEAIKDYITV